MKVLVVGSGAREHSLTLALQADPAVAQVLCAPGNPGMAKVATCHPLPGGVTDTAAVLKLAQAQKVDLVVIGPEAPLVAGMADALRDSGIDTVGPSAAAARLEGSKAFAKDVMAAAGVPTAESRVCTDLDEVTSALDAMGSPYVVKDDGLAAGKGVVVTDSRVQALAHAAQSLARENGRIVVEEFLDGPEVSVFCLTDGATVVPLPPAQDFKRVGDGDVGPNTGGMGAYSPLTWAGADLAERVVATVAQPTIDEMDRRGTPFQGVLYCGLAMTSKGPRVVEFNARIGDPDGPASLARLATPLGGLLKSVATGTLALHPPLETSADSAVVVVVASKGYPESPRTGYPLTGVEDAEQVPGVTVLHAGTEIGADGVIRSAGGRVLTIVATAPDLRQARRSAYQAVSKIHLQDSHHRRDIAAWAAEQQADDTSNAQTTTAQPTQEERA